VLWNGIEKRSWEWQRKFALEGDTYDSNWKTGKSRAGFDRKKKSY
jgi:hypothetical protein